MIGMVADGGANVLGSVAIIVASVIVILQNRQQGKKVQDAALNVEQVQQTLTTKNGGSHVKDQLDRIEEHLERLDMRGDLQDRFNMRMENKFNRHLLWSNDVSQDHEKRINDLEGKE